MTNPRWLCKFGWHSWNPWSEIRNRSMNMFLYGVFKTGAFIEHYQNKVCKFCNLTIERVKE